MKNLILSECIQGTISLHLNGLFIGRISKGHINGEWWCEPNSDKLPELIKGKKQAIKFLTMGTPKATIRFVDKTGQ